MFTDNLKKKYQYTYNCKYICNYYDEISMSYMAYVITLENTEEPNLSYTIN